jgi:hypothetical protein
MHRIIETGLLLLSWCDLRLATRIRITRPTLISHLVLLVIFLIRFSANFLQLRASTYCIYIPRHKTKSGFQG